MTKRDAPTAFMKPQQPDAVLAAIVGADPLARTEITIRLWRYIKEHGLQDATKRQKINAGGDEAFRALIDGKDSCTMFELPKYTNAHLSPVTPA